MHHTCTRKFVNTHATQHFVCSCLYRCEQFARRENKICNWHRFILYIWSSKALLHVQCLVQ